MRVPTVESVSHPGEVRSLLGYFSNFRRGLDSFEGTDPVFALIEL
jgi:hypothetical protein